jgi:CheY-like chemotaxis protein
MLPYFHPTSIVLVDDDQPFLDSLAFSPVGDFRHTAFTRPDDALRFILARHRLLPRIDDFFVPHDDEIDAGRAQPGDRLLQLKADRITAIANDPARLDVVSVVVIDFDMPVMTGLQLCRALTNYPVRKLMLTGKAGTEVGVQALNEGLIDGYLVKQDANLGRILHGSIAQQQQAFFKELTQPLRLALCWDELAFTGDSDFALEFQGLLAQRQVIEMYVSSLPPGYLCRKSDGTIEMAVVYDDQALENHAEIAREAGADAELINLLERRAVLPLFPNGSFYIEAYAASWRTYVFPLRRIGQSRLWYISFVPVAGGLDGRGVVARV